MNCEEVMELMQRSLDGDLDSAETSRMHEHIQACPECAALYDRLTRLSDNLAKLPRVTPSISIVDSILPRLEEIELRPAAADESRSDDARPLPNRAASRPRRLYRRVAGAIAAGIAAGLLIVALPQLRPSHSDQDASYDSASLSGANNPAASSSASASADSDENRMSLKFSGPVGDSAAASSDAAANGAPGASASPFAVNGGGIAAEPQSTSAGGEEPTPENGTMQPVERDVAPALKDKGAPKTGSGPAESAQPTGEAGGQALAPADGDVKGFTSTAASASVWNSPDGKYAAKVEDDRLTVSETANGSVVFQSDPHPDSEIADVVWDGDSAALHYAWTDASGSQVRLVWTAATGKESPDSEADGERK